MEDHIDILNEYATNAKEKKAIEKQVSGKMLKNIIYFQIGNKFQLPHDMSFEISSYLLYFDYQSEKYLQKQSFEFYFFLYKIILNVSVTTFSRYYNEIFHDDDDLNESWDILEYGYVIYPYLYYDDDTIMNASNCSVCGNYSSTNVDVPSCIKCYC